MTSEVLTPCGGAGLYNDPRLLQTEGVGGLSLVGDFAAALDLVDSRAFHTYLKCTVMECYSIAVQLLNLVVVVAVVDEVSNARDEFKSNCLVLLSCTTVATTATTVANHSQKKKQKNK